LPTGPECFFINVTNVSRPRDVELTHVWFDTTPQLTAIQAQRPLPKRLKPDEAWETWVEIDRIPTNLGESVFELARARLSNGTVIKSKKNKDVPSVGTIPGGT
jgi:hypothetical protein